MIARIVITGTDQKLDKAFDYNVPGEMRVSLGMRVIVPFGRSNRHVEGVVVEMPEFSDYDELKNIHEVIGDKMVVPKSLIELSEWMRDKYFCTQAQALRLMLPPRTAMRIQEWLILNEDFDIANTNKILKSSKTACEIVKFLGSCGGIAEYGEIYENVKRSNLKRVTIELEQKGIISIHEKGIQEIKDKYIRMVRLAISPSESLLIAEQIESRAPVQAAMLRFLSNNECMSAADVVMCTEGTYTSLTTLKNKGWIEIEETRIKRRAYNEGSIEKSYAYTPTSEQKTAIDYINSSLGKYSRMLIHGVTGSGKTEVFLQAIGNCLERNKRAIVLVPEISLTPQMVQRFVGRFGSRVAVVHSALSAGERHDEWRRILDNEVDVVVGARSAIFAPIENIGIIILDEEHEYSYKSEIAPKYHAREVAEKRAEDADAVLLLASATPALESYYKAKCGEYKLLTLKERFNKALMPEVSIVDMRDELILKHNTSILSGRLAEELQRNLDSGEKSILFLNRRGYSTFVSCRECGYVVLCDNCSISLTYHQSGNILSCHYCGYSRTNLSVCPECNSRYIKFFGTGTQKAEEEIVKRFPKARVLRMDVDTTSKKGGHEQILKQFGRGEADILIGTQMVTKGLDFHDVTLVGVLAADSSLYIDDYKANERTFSLLTQVSGRAGRGDKPGRAVIQTYQPDNEIILLAKKHDYLNFYKGEIKLRQGMEYPPFCDIVSIVLSGSDEIHVAKNIKEISKFIKAQNSTDIMLIMGPVAAPIAKIKKRFRYRILVKCKYGENISTIIRDVMKKHDKMKGDTHLSIDVNPNNMS